MSNLSFVGVTQDVHHFKDRGETRDTLDQRVCKWITELGFMSSPIPNKMGNSELSDNVFLHNWLEKLNPKAFVLTGGSDIGLAPDRDRTELYVLNYAQERDLPVLGICRGMQLMGISAGVTLKAIDGHVGTRHKLRGKISTEVNSFHKFSLKRCPDDYEVLAKSEDNEIEAISHLSLPWEGWMWHPEREKVYSNELLNRARKLFGAG
jgi:putative glutamine amidotransferase